MVPRCFLLLVLVSPLLALPAVAAPSVTNVSQRGLRVGATTRVVVEGTDLLPEPRLLLPIPIEEQSVEPGATAQRVEFVIALDKATPSGIYPLRVASVHGISPPTLVSVDTLDHVQSTGRAAQVAQLPAVVAGNVTGTQIFEAHFSGEKGSPFVAEVESARLGAQLRPVLRLLDGNGRQIIWTAPRPELEGDTRFHLTLPETGGYTVQLHDVLYRGSQPGHFRLKLGDFHYADLIYPLGVQAGDSATVHYLGGTLPPGATSTFAAPQLTRPADVSAPMPAGFALSVTSLPPLRVSLHPELTEDQDLEPAEAEPLPTPPLAITGRLDQNDQVDVYTVPVEADRAMRLELYAQRAGSPLDGVLVVKTPEGKELARSDDRPGTPDPGLELTVPGDVDEVHVNISDLLGRGGAQYVYRLEIQQPPERGFDLTLETDTINIPSGAAQAIQVRALRRGFDGPIELLLEDFPAQLKVAGATIPQEGSLALLTLTAPDTQEPVSAFANIVGRGGDNVVTAEVTGSQTRSESQLGIAIAPAAPVRLAWASDEKLSLLQGTKQEVQVQVIRSPGVAHPIRLRLMSTQPAVTKTVKEGNRDTTVADTERMLRLEGEPILEPGAQEATAQILVPVDLPAREWNFAIVAEVLSDDKKTVLSTTSAPLRSAEVKVPLAITLDGETRIEARAGEGETGVLRGTVQRAEGFAYPVTLKLEGLPEGYTSPTVTLPADQDKFELPVRFAADASTGELQNVQLVASAAPDAEKAELVVKSHGLPLSVHVVAAQ